MLKALTTCNLAASSSNSHSPPESVKFFTHSGVQSRDSSFSRESLHAIEVASAPGLAKSVPLTQVVRQGSG